VRFSARSFDLTKNRLQPSPPLKKWATIRLPRDDGDHTGQNGDRRVGRELETMESKLDAGIDDESRCRRWAAGNRHFTGGSPPGTHSMTARLVATLAR
jgi:hypothetical protein